MSTETSIFLDLLKASIYLDDDCYSMLLLIT